MAQAQTLFRNPSRKVPLDFGKRRPWPAVGSAVESELRAMAIEVIDDGQQLGRTVEGEEPAHGPRTPARVRVAVNGEIGAIEEKDRPRSTGRKTDDTRFHRCRGWNRGN